MKNKLTTKTKQKLEALIRFDIENAPYKYRDVHEMYFHGLPAYKNILKDEIDEMFKDYELEITDEDIQWATFNK